MRAHHIKKQRNIMYDDFGNADYESHSYHIVILV